MAGSDYDFGTPGMWKVLFWLAMIGLGTVSVGFITLVVWLFAHLRWAT